MDIHAHTAANAHPGPAVVADVAARKANRLDARHATAMVTAVDVLRGIPRFLTNAIENHLMGLLAHPAAAVHPGPAAGATVATRTEDHPVAPTVIQGATVGPAALHTT
jgi:hypothetical protein